MVITKVRLKETSSCPPDGFVYETPNKQLLRGYSMDSTVQSALRWHKENYIEHGDLWALVEEHTAKRLQELGKLNFLKFEIQSLTKQHDRLWFIDSTKLIPAPHHYNPALTEIDGDLWMCYRMHKADGFSDNVMVKLDKAFQPIPETNKVIDIPKIYDDQDFEDPRLWWFEGKLHLSYTMWRRTLQQNGKWLYMPRIESCTLDKDFNVTETQEYSWGGNRQGQMQKNWTFFEHDGQLHWTYFYDPHQVVKIEDGMEKLAGNHKGMEWQWGVIRGGTPPVRVGNEYWAFTHSRQGNIFAAQEARYFAGVYCFEAGGQFKPTRWIPEPLLVGSELDKQWAGNLKCVFPSGCVRRGDDLVVSIGSNDMECAIGVFSIDELAKKMIPL